jgi:hypothetical protein
MFFFTLMAKHKDVSLTIERFELRVFFLIWSF